MADAACLFCARAGRRTGGPVYRAELNMSLLVDGHEPDGGTVRFLICEAHRTEAAGQLAMIRGAFGGSS